MIKVGRRNSPVSPLRDLRRLTLQGNKSVRRGGALGHRRQEREQDGVGGTSQRLLAESERWVKWTASARAPWMMSKCEHWRIEQRDLVHRWGSSSTQPMNIRDEFTHAEAHGPNVSGVGLAR